MRLGKSRHLKNRDNVRLGKQPNTCPLASWPIKLVSLALLIVVAWPIPQMIGFSNPARGLVMDRYAPKYFILMAAYIGVVLAWAVLTGWVVIRLTPERLEQIRRQLALSPGLVLGLVIFVIITALSLRSADLAHLIVDPGSFGPLMRLIPSLACTLFVTLAALTVDSRIVEQIEHMLGTGEKAPVPEELTIRDAVRATFKTVS